MAVAESAKLLAVRLLKLHQLIPKANEGSVSRHCGVLVHTSGCMSAHGHAADQGAHHMVAPWEVPEHKRAPAGPMAVLSGA